MRKIQINLKWLNSYDYFTPMYSNTNHHDMEQKEVLGELFPAGQTPEQNLSQALDLLFNHSNTPVYFSTLLIKRLTISNPRRVYIDRVADVFKDNGYGIRGDLKAIIKAVLLDSDVLERKAMANYQATGKSSSNFGKVKEPVIAMANLARALGVQSNDSDRWWDFPNLGNNHFGQAPLEAPSVFNFYEPDYAPKGEISDLELYAPEFNILGMDPLRNTSNRMWSSIESHDSNHHRSWHWDRGEFEQSINDTDLYIELLDKRFFGGTMPSHLSGSLKNMLLAHEQNGHSTDRRINDTLFAIQCSPEFRCQE